MTKWIMPSLWALVGAGLLVVVLPMLTEIETTESGEIVVDFYSDAEGSCVLITRPAPYRTSISFVISGGTLGLLTAAMNLAATIRRRRRD